MVRLSPVYSKYFNITSFNTTDYHLILDSTTFYFQSREKKFVNINIIIAEIWKVKRIEKEIALNNAIKQLLLQKMASNRWQVFNNVYGLCSRDFDEETGKLHVKNYLKYLFYLTLSFFSLFSFGLFFFRLIFCIVLCFLLGNYNLNFSFV